MKIGDITPVILTFNEAPNLRATLDSLPWAERIIIVDSGSTDETLAIASEFSNTTVFHRQFDNHTNQWNYGIEQAETGLVLTLDADYLCPLGLKDELEQCEGSSEVYFAKFSYCVWGHELRGSLYPPRAVLFDPRKCRYIPDGHTQILDVSYRTVDFLESVIRHDDRKPLARWCSSQVEYAKLEADKLYSGDAALLTWKDRLRKRVVLAPALSLVYCLFAKRLILDGRAGLFYTFQRVFAELLLSLSILEQRLK